MKWIAPGPVVPMQTPSRAVCLAKPQAMNAAALFVADRNELDLIPALAKRLDCIDPITDNSKSMAHAPINRGFDDNVAMMFWWPLP